MKCSKEKGNSKGILNIEINTNIDIGKWLGKVKLKTLRRKISCMLAGGKLKVKFKSILKDRSSTTTLTTPTTILYWSVKLYFN